MTTTTNIRQDWYGNTFETISFDEFITRVEEGVHPTYEVINDIIRYNFDFDNYCNKEDFDLETANYIEEECEKHIYEFLLEYTGQKPIIAKATSHTNNYDGTRGKYSVRYYVSNMKDHRTNIEKFVKYINSELCKRKIVLFDCIEIKDNKIFDESIYSPSKKLRCINTSKPNQDRPLILKSGSIQDTIVNNINDCIEVNFQKSSYPNVSPNSVEEETIALTEDELKLNDVEFLLNVCIQHHMCETQKHKEWILVGQILKNELKDQSIQPFINWTNKFGSDNKKEECYEQISKYIKYTPLKDKNRVTFKTLHYYAKLYNPSKYQLKYCPKSETSVLDIDNILYDNGEYGIAKYFKKYFGSNFVCTDAKNKICYEFTKNKIWQEFKDCTNIREILSNEMFNSLTNYQDKLYEYSKTLNPDTEENEKTQRKLKKCAELLIKLQKTNDKNNITREILDIIKDEAFIDDMNKEKYIIPVKNGKILNMKTLEMSERTINHKFNFECNASYVSMSEAEESEIRQYFLDLFCGNEGTMKTTIDIIKSIFTGETLRYIYFFTGKGSNGKSLLFKLLNKIFGKLMDTIDTKVILQSKATSGLTTEFEKLDRCRLGYITELREDDKLNETIIKKISGGDPIDYRGLFKSNKTIYPTCNLCALTNELPHFKVENAILNRIIVIPFNNTFAVNSSFETEMMSKLDLIFSFIMKHGTIRDSFHLTDEMKVAKDQYKEDNITIDYLKDYIENNYQIVPFVKTEKVSRDSFRDSYNSYLKSKQRPIDNSSHTKFARSVKTYGIDIKESNGKTYYINLVEKVQVDDEEE